MIGAIGSAQATITIGATSAISNGVLTLYGAVASAITIGNAAQTGTVNIGVSSAGMTLNLGTGDGAKTIDIGTGTGTDTINIGTGIGTDVITIGVATDASSLFLYAGSGDIAMLTNSGTGETITITNTQGNVAAAIGLTASAGGITITATNNEILLVTGTADVVISGNAAGTAALTMTLGDFVVTDSDTSTMTSVNGVGTLLTLTNTSGVIASDAAVLNITAGGAVASGGNLLRIVPSGTPDVGAIGIEFVGASKLLTALYIDADPTGSSVAQIQGGGALTNDFAVLVVSSDGALATGGNTFRVDTTGEPASGAIYAEFDFAGITDTNENVGVSIDAGGKKVQALKIDADPLANDVVYIHSDAVIATDKALLNLNHDTGNLAAGANILRIDPAGGTPNADARFLEIDAAAVTDTNEPYALYIDAGGKKIRALYIDADPTTNDVAYIHSDAVIASGKALLSLHSQGTTASGGNILRITSASAPDTGAILLEMDVQHDAQALKIDTDALASDAVYITHSGILATGKSVMHVTDLGTPADDTVAVIKAAFTGTDTNESMIFYAAGTGKDVVGLYVDTDNVLASNSASILVYNDTAGAQGPTIVGHQNSATPAAGDQLLGIWAYGEEGTSGDTMEYGQITFEVEDASDGAIRGTIKMGVADGSAGASNMRESFVLSDDVLLIGDGAAVVFSSQGSQDLSISTAATAAGLASNEPKIVLTDGNAGDITITAGGTSGEIVLASQLVKTVQAGITAQVDASQANATVITGNFVEVAVVAGVADSVALPEAIAGLQITVINHGANSMGLFPINGGDDGINEENATTKYDVAVNVTVICTAWSGTDWECQKMSR